MQVRTHRPETNIALLGWFIPGQVLNPFADRSSRIIKHILTIKYHSAMKRLDQVVLPALIVFAGLFSSVYGEKGKETVLESSKEEVGQGLRIGKQVLQHIHSRRASRHDSK